MDSKYAYLVPMSRYKQTILVLQPLQQHTLRKRHFVLVSKVREDGHEGEPAADAVEVNECNAETLGV
jgi:hypothetical protein